MMTPEGKAEIKQRLDKLKQECQHWERVGFCLDAGDVLSLLDENEQLQKLSADIEVHFEMNMPIEMQRNLGVDNNDSRPMQLRIMRVIAHCVDLEEKNIALQKRLDEIWYQKKERSV